MNGVRIVAFLAILTLVPASAGAVLPHLFAGKWGARGSGLGQMNGPEGIAVDAARDVYVSDSNNHRIQKFDSGGEPLLTWGAFGSGVGQLQFPGAVAVGPSGSVYVADTGNHRMQKFSSSGQFFLAWGSMGSGPSQFNTPRGVAVSTLNEVYVVDSGNDRIQKFDADGGFLLQWGSSGSGDGQFSFPVGIAIDPAGAVYIADNFNNRVQKFDAGGAFLLKWGVAGSGDGQLIGPRHVASDAAGDVYVVDRGNDRIQRFDPSGAFVEKWGSLGSGNGQFNGPLGVALDGIGTAYATDGNNHRIQKFATPPSILSVEDMPNDQGRQVRIRFDRSSLDVGARTRTVLQYEAFRRIDALPAPGANLPAEPAGVASGIPPLNPLAPSGALVAGWEFVGAIPAHAEAEYTLLAPTAADSTAGSGIVWSVFFVRAATDDPGIFLDSARDSGYSTDDLAPNAPQGFAVTGVTPQGDVDLAWDVSQDSDFRFFSLYRSTEPDFVPGEDNRIATVIETSYTDPGASQVGLQLYYKLTATDFAGNEGTPSQASVAITGASGHPAAYRLHACVPNPVRTAAAIGFELPVAGRVRLRIFDASGRIVRHALGDVSLPAGGHRWIWDRRDDHGRRVGAGLYLYRLDTAVGPFSRKAVVTD